MTINLEQKLTFHFELSAMTLCNYNKYQVNSTFWHGKHILWDIMWWYFWQCIISTWSYTAVQNLQLEKSKSGHTKNLAFWFLAVVVKAPWLRQVIRTLRLRDAGLWSRSMVGWCGNLWSSCNGSRLAKYTGQLITPLTLSVPHFCWLWQKRVYQSVQSHTGLTFAF